MPDQHPLGLVYTKKRGAELSCSFHVLRPSHCLTSKNKQSRRPTLYGIYKYIHIRCHYLCFVRLMFILKVAKFQDIRTEAR